MEVVTDTQVTPEVIDELRSGPAKSAGFPYQTQAYQGIEPSPDDGTRHVPPVESRRRMAPVIVGCLLLATFFGLSYSLWNAMGRYSAYGVVTGRVVDVYAPIDGQLVTLAVQDGDSVEHGARLGTLYSLELEQQIARVADELRVAEAALLSETAKLTWTQIVMGADQELAAAEFYEAWGRFDVENARLGFLERELERIHAVNKRGGLPASKLDKAKSETEGQRQRLEKLSERLEALKKRAGSSLNGSQSAAVSSSAGQAAFQATATAVSATDISETADRQLSEARARIEALSNELNRLQKRLSLSSLIAPVDGIIVKRHRPAGELVRSQEILFSLVAADSMQIELFIPQKMAATIRVGDNLHLSLRPYCSSLECEVTRIGDRFAAPPAHLEKFYRPKEALLPVYLVPKPGLWETSRIPLGSVAKLPHRWLAD